MAAAGAADRTNGRHVPGTLGWQAGTRSQWPVAGSRKSRSAAWPQACLPSVRQQVTGGKKEETLELPTTNTRLADPCYRASVAHQ
jgi:hypothetical protein